MLKNLSQCLLHVSARYRTAIIFPATCPWVIAIPMELSALGVAYPEHKGDGSFCVIEIIEKHPSFLQ